MYVVPKIQLRAPGDIRKSANGHCTATNTTKKARPIKRARVSGRQVLVRCRIRSIDEAPE